MKTRILFATAAILALTSSGAFAFSNDNDAYVTQLGNDSKAVQVLGGTSGNIVSAEQGGSSNRDLSVQKVDGYGGNVVGVYQDGYKDTANQSVSGNSNTATISQTGENGFAKQVISGSGNTVSAAQQGNLNKSIQIVH